MVVYEAESGAPLEEFDFIKRFKKDGDAQATPGARISRDLLRSTEMGIVE